MIKRTDNVAFGGPATVLAELLYQSEHLAVNDGRMSILENLPFLRRLVNSLLVLEGLGGAAEIHRIAAVLLLAEDVSHSSRAPVVWDGRRLAAISADIAPMLRRCGHFFAFRRLAICVGPRPSTHQAKIWRTVLAASSSTIQPFLLSGSFRYP